MSQPLIIQTFSSAGSEAEAAAETAKQLRERAGSAPVQGGLVYSTVDYAAARLQPELSAQLGPTPFVGATSCAGLATGAQGARAKGLAGLWFAGSGFKFGTASLAKGGADPRELGARLARAALAAGGIAASAARFAVLHGTPGDEESVLQGIHSVLPKEAVLIGGSAADNDLSGKWKVWTAEGVTGEGVTLAVCDWPWRMVFQCLGAHAPTGKKGKVTAVSGRILKTIDHRPAAEVYNEWTGGKFSKQLAAGGPILSESTLVPLGVQRLSALEGTHVLVHPERIIAPQGHLSLFAEVRPGETIELMQGTIPALTSHGARLAQWALGANAVEPSEVLGGLFINCAGCTLALGAKRDEMISKFQAAIGKGEFVAMFPFGEQSAYMGRPEHGNLMTGVLLLSGRK